MDNSKMSKILNSAKENGCDLTEHEVQGLTNPSEFDSLSAYDDFMKDLTGTAPIKSISGKIASDTLDDAIENAETADDAAKIQESRDTIYGHFQDGFYDNVSNFYDSLVCQDIEDETGVVPSSFGKIPAWLKRADTDDDEIEDEDEEEPVEDDSDVVEVFDEEE